MGTFTTFINRKNTRSVKWDLVDQLFQGEDLLPMWIADMDFPAPKAVSDAIIERAKHGIYGYPAPDHDVFLAIMNWLEKRHQFSVKKEYISYSPSVVTSLHMAVLAYTEPGEKVLVQTPVYNPFYEVIAEHDREIVKNELIYNEQTNKYEIDFDELEKQLAGGVKAFILCSPHNPVGRVWTKDELKKMAELCLEYGVIIISDEIHSDIIYKGYKHYPIASLSEEIASITVTLMAPSKTFNVAGLHSSFSIISNPTLRKKFRNQLKKFGFSGLNVIGIYALEAAYKYGEEWLEELLEVLEENKRYVQSEFNTHAPQLKVVDAEGTFLLWIDCSELNMNTKELERFFLKEAKIALNKGSNYGEEGSQYMRMNIGCPRSILEQGVAQIIQAVKNIR